MVRARVGMLGVAAAAVLTSCGGSGGGEACAAEYGMVFDGASCRDPDPCGSVSCGCSGVQNSVSTCGGGQCLTAIDCDAWCGASNAEQLSCIQKQR